MNWDTIAADWRQLKSRLRRLWGKVAGAGNAAANGTLLPRR
jgi:uncharacterized protein YjbJ (UPF0337 family)